jgi:hypothetical protein
MFIAIVFILMRWLPNNDIHDAANKSLQKNISQIQGKTTGRQEERKKLIIELKNFRNAFNHKEKIGISRYFKFPLNDSVISFSGIDSALDVQLKKNGNEVNEKMFQEHFSRIYEYLQMDQFSKLFQNLNVDSLLSKNKLTREKHHKNMGCYHIYQIIIDGTEVTLFYGTNSDRSYMATHPDEAEVCAEHSSIWTFLFDGKKLQFKKLVDAD